MKKYLLLFCALALFSCVKPEDTPSEQKPSTIDSYAEGKTTVFSSFSFTVADNAGKILAKEVYYNGSRTTVKKCTEQKLSVNSKGNVSGCIPYLYDFKLAPKFTLKDKGAFAVYCNGEIQESGKSVQDFSSEVSYAIVDTVNHIRANFTVSVTNTGLPVVVLTQKGSYTSSVSWLDMNVPAKTCSFGTSDEIAIWKNGKEILPKMNCGYRLRGNITRQYPKKAFGLKLAEKKSILGLGQNKRYDLIANWKDNTQLRNDLALKLSREFVSAFSGEDAGMKWNPAGEYVELVLNGEHVGLYYLCEHIKIGGHRLDIQDPYEDQTNPTFENCGYLLEFDNYYDEDYKFKINNKSTLPVNCKDPFDGTATGQAIFKALQDRLTQLDNYITSKDFTSAYELLDINAAADYMLLQELVMNNEYKHPRSVYAWMDGGKDKLHFGPCWDYDVWTFPVIDQIRYYNYETYVHDYKKFQFKTEVMNTSSTYVWFKLLDADPSFQQKLRDRWTTLSSVAAITPDGVDAYIDKRVEEIGLSVDYNREMWPHPSYEYTDDYMNGDETSYSRGGGTLYSYEETIAMLKKAYRARFQGMSSAVK